MSKTAEEILKDHFIKSMAIDKPDWPEIERIESVNNTMTREPLFLSTLKSAMTEFASQDSDRRLQEYQTKVINLIKENTLLNVFGEPTNKDLIKRIKALNP